MTLVLVGDTWHSRLEAKEQRPFLAPAFGNLVDASNAVPPLADWYLTTLYQPKSYRKAWRPSVEDVTTAVPSLLERLAVWCEPGQYPCPVVVTLGKAVSQTLLPDMSFDDDWHTPHKRHGEHYVVFPLQCEPSELYGMRPTSRLITGLAALAKFIGDV